SEGKVREVFIARDADPFVTRPVMDACETAKIRITEIDTMSQLGVSCGIEVKASVAGLFK
ncbi:MAG: 50S ribosomal protein L7Ae-like protein, partial [Clostridia bacterium]|nr:50S ribosomal protein L7Ae-like protein [Clostridia bacterium]